MAGTSVQKNGSFGVGARESAARALEDDGEIQFVIVCNDGSDLALERLTSLKNIFAAQLPKMPREYIVRLVFDKRHVSLAIMRGTNAILGGICYRPYYDEEFAEIAFCAITANEQVRGFGTRVMNHLKNQAKHDGIKYFLTYADNLAIGYFKKQGFSKTVKYLSRDAWYGRIKDYDGGTLMECYVHPTIHFLNVQDTVKKQSNFIAKRLSLCDLLRQDDRAAPEAKTKNNDQAFFYLPHNSPSQFTTNGTHTQKKKKLNHHQQDEADLLSDESLSLLEAIPGLRELGYTENELRKLARPNDPYGEKQKEELTSAKSLVDKLKKHDDAWPFLEPVDTTQVTDYLEVIPHPIDLGTIELNLKSSLLGSLNQGTTNTARAIGKSLSVPSSKYFSFAQVKSDIYQMLENCRKYNGTGLYVKTADSLQRVLDLETRKLEDALARFHAAYDAQHDLLS